MKNTSRTLGGRRSRYSIIRNTCIHFMGMVRTTLYTNYEVGDTLWSGLPLSDVTRKVKNAKYDRF